MRLLYILYFIHNSYWRKNINSRVLNQRKKLVVPSANEACISYGGSPSRLMIGNILKQRKCRSQDTGNKLERRWSFHSKVYFFSLAPLATLRENRLARPPSTVLFNERPSPSMSNPNGKLRVLPGIFLTTSLKSVTLSWSNRHHCLWTTSWVGIRTSTSWQDSLGIWTCEHSIR